MMHGNMNIKLPDISLSHRIHTCCGHTKLPVQLLSVAFKPKIREAACSAKVRNVWKCTATPSIRLDKCTDVLQPTAFALTFRNRASYI